MRSYALSTLLEKEGDRRNIGDWGRQHVRVK